MVRCRALLNASLGLAPAALLMTLALGRPSDRDPVYSVAAVQAHLAKDPRAWMNRMLLLRGVARSTGCYLVFPDASAPCVGLSMVLGDADPAASAPLPLTLAYPGPLLAMARRLPLLGSFAPGSQAIRWAMVATYRVQLRPMAAGSCGGAVCYEAVVLDAGP